MIVRSLDQAGDWTFGQSRNNYFTGNMAIAQNILTRVSSFVGDCFFALNAGIDWWNLLGSKNQIALELSVSSIILNTYGVTGILDLEVGLDEDRKLVIRYTVSTIYTDRLTRNIGLSLLTTESGLILTDEFGNELATG